MSILDQYNEDKVVIKRLKRITEERKKLEVKRTTDPFRKTFLEKIRDVVGLGVNGGRQHWIRAKLRWFAGSEFWRDEVTQEIDKSFKISRSMHMLTSEQQGVNYAVDTLDPTLRFDDSGRCTDEYLSLLREQQQQQPANDMDFSTSEGQVIAISASQNESTKRISSDDGRKINPEFKKSTTELFLSVHNYMQDKEKTQETEKLCTEIEKPRLENFAATNLWVQSEEYLPGEQWDGAHSFDALPDKKVDESTRAGEKIMDDASRMIGMLLAKADPAMIAMDAV